jgi:mevalonate kinase
MNRNTIKVSAPGKLMLFGEHAVIYGKPCIVTAVDQRIHMKIEKISGDLLIINAPEVKVKNYIIGVSKLGRVVYPKEIAFVLKAVENFFKKHRVSSGLKIFTKSEFSSLFGFGSSSAVTVCVIKSLSELFDIQVDNKSLFDMAYKTVLEVQGVGSGFDLAAAIWGGTIYYITGGEKITPLKIGKLPLVVGYTGIKADTATLVHEVASLYKTNRKVVGRIFDAMGVIVESAETAFSERDYKKLGKLMNLNQGLLDSLGVSTETVSKLIFAARQHKAYGAKLSGAGGGDCIIALSSPKRRVNVESAIKAVGGTILNVKTGAEGVRIEI